MEATANLITEDIDKMKRTELIHTSRYELTTKTFQQHSKREAIHKFEIKNRKNLDIEHTQN